MIDRIAVIKQKLDEAITQICESSYRTDYLARSHFESRLKVHLQSKLFCRRTYLQTILSWQCIST